VRVLRRVVLVVVAALALSAAAVPALALARRTVPRGWVGTVAGLELVDHPDLVPGQFAVMARSGVESVRAEFGWDEIEPQPGSYNWGHADAIVTAAARHRLALLPTVLRAPAWAAAPGGSGATPHPRDPADYGSFMTALVDRYGPHGSFWSQNPTLPRRPIRAWEIWNEPDLRYYWKPPWRKPYLALLRAAHAAITAADPGAQVVLGGLTYFSWRDLDRLYALKARGLFDVVSLHPYTHWVKSVVKTMALVRAVMNSHGDRAKPIWVTELSWGSGQGHARASDDFVNATPKGQAQLLRSAYLALAKVRRRYGIGRVYWYTWASHDRSRTDPFDWSGLRRLRGSKTTSKPAFYAFVKVAHALEGRR
jgi:hypothetical protein